MRSPINRSVLFALSATSLGLVAACQIQISPLGAQAPVAPTANASAHLETGSTAAGRGVIIVNIRGFLDSLLKNDRQVLAAVSDVDHVTVTVNLTEGQLTKTITKAGIVSGKTTATFTGLLPGPVTVGMAAYDNTNLLIGSTSQPATIVSGENTVVDLTLQLNPTYVPPGGIGSDLPPTGDITASGVLVDGPIVSGTPTPAPTGSSTPTPTATATPTVTPTATPTPGPTVGPITATMYQIGSQPRAVAVDSAGRGWVAHVANGAGFPSVSELSPTGSLVMSIASTDGPGKDPSDIAVDSAGNIWVANEGSDVADAHRGKISKFSPTGSLLFSTYVDVGVKKIVLDAANNAWIVNQRAAGAYMAAQPDGSLAPMAGSNTVVEVSNAGAVIGTFAFTSAVNDVAIDPAGNVWVTHGSNTNGKVTKLSTAGAVLGTYSMPSGITPLGITFDGAGYAWIAGSKGTGTAGDVFKVSASGIIWGTYPVGVSPKDVVIDGAGYVWVSNTGSGTLSKLSQTGTPVATYQVGAGPTALAAGSSGVWVANGGTTTVSHLVP